MPHEFDKDRLVHYFAGECSEEERARIAVWIGEDPARLQQVEALRHLWEATSRKSSQNWDLDGMWAKIERQLEEDSAQQSRRRVRPRPSRKPRRSARRRRIQRRSSRGGFRIAAAALLVAVVAFLAMEVFISPEGPGVPSAREIATAAGERARVLLSDGTQVLLGPRSTLVLPEEFAAKVREVRLQGKAYFEVAPDQERPFIVHAGEAIVQVLGTEFSTEAYPDDEDVQVVVAEGRVAMRVKQAKGAEGAVLTRGQMGRLSRGTGRVVRQQIDLSRQLAWIDGRLTFTDTPFEEVAEKLARHYGLEVNLANSSMRVDRLNATFKNEPVAVVLEVIATTLGLRYEREGRAVTFYPADPNASRNRKSPLRERKAGVMPG